MYIYVHYIYINIHLDINILIHLFMYIHEDTCVYIQMYIFKSIFILLALLLSDSFVFDVDSRRLRTRIR